MSDLGAPLTQDPQAQQPGAAPLSVSPAMRRIMARKQRAALDAQDPGTAAPSPAPASGPIEPPRYQAPRRHADGTPSSLLDDSVTGVAADVRAQMGLERFDRARYLKDVVTMGVGEDDLDDNDKQTLQEFRSRLAQGWANEFAAAKRSANEAPRTVMDKAMVGVEAFVGGFVDAIPATLWGFASIIDNDLPRTLNEAIGIQGLEAPRVGAYLRAFSESNGWVLPELKSAQPLSDTYQQMVRSGEMFEDKLPWLAQLGLGAARAGGELIQTVGTGGASIVGRGIAKGVAKAGLTSVAERAATWASGAQGRAGIQALARRVAGRSAADIADVGTRFAVAQGLTEYVDPNTGLVKDGWERFTSAATTALMMPAFTAISAGAAKLASRITGGGAAATRSAYARWVSGLDDAARARLVDPQQAWGAFVEAGMPGVSRSLVKTAAAGVMQSTLEGIGFSALDKHWWQDGIDAIVDQDGEALERFLGTAIQNSMMMQILRFGGTARALEAWRLKRIADRANAGRAPAEPPKQPPEPKPEPPPRQEPPDVIELGSHETMWDRAERLARAAENLYLREGVTEALTKKADPKRRAAVEYAARVREWADGNFEGPEPKYRGEEPPEVAEARKALRSDYAPAKPRTEPKPRDRAAEQEMAEAREYLRDAEALEAKLALEGIGDPAPVESMRIVTRTGEKAKLVTYRDGKYLERDLYTAKPEWKEIPPERAAEIAKMTAARKPVQAQLAAVDVAAKRALQISETMTPEQARMVGAALHAVATIPAAKDAGIAAALEMMTLLPPMGWEPRHFDAWAQIALRGMTPTAQKAIIEGFLSEGARKPREQQAAQPAPEAEPAKPGETPQGQPSAAPQTEPGAPEATANRTEAATAPSGEASPETASARDVASRVGEAAAARTAALDAEAVEALARAMGIEPTEANLERLREEMREDGVEEVAAKIPKADEAGAANVGALAGVVAMGATLSGLYAAGVPASYIVGVGAIPIIAPYLMRNWASSLYERVTRFGRPRQGQAVKQLLLQTVDLQARLAGEVTDALVRLRVMAGEQPVDLQRTGRREIAMAVGSAVAGTAAGAAIGGPIGAPLGTVLGSAFGVTLARMSLARRGNQAEVARNREAARHLDEVNWNPTREWGSSNSLEILDGWRTVDPAKDPAGTQDLADAFQRVMVELGQIENREGVVMTDPTTGRTFRVRFNPERRRMPRVRTQDGVDVLGNPNHPGRSVFERAVAALNNITLAEAKVALREMAGRAAFSRGSFEITRQVRFMPDWIRVNGQEIQLFETRPFEAAGRIASSSMGRVGSIKTFGQELPIEATAPGAALRIREVLGARLPATATRQQIRNRKMLVRFIETAPRPDEALQALTDVQRALHGMPIDNPMRGFAPGQAGHKVARALWPLRSLAIALKLSKTAAVNVPEPFGTPATFLGQPAIAGAFLRTYGELMFEGVEPLRQEAMRFQRMGDVVDPIIPRFSKALGRARGPGTRALDIAANVEHLAFPQRGVNWLNDIIIARAGETVLDNFAEAAGKMSPGRRARWMETMNQLDFTPSEAATIVDGNATPELRASYLRRLRSYTMGVRQNRAEQGFLQQLRNVKAWMPFQGYMSNNYRVWGRAMKEYVRGFSRGKVGTPEATAKRRFLVRHVRNKLVGAAWITGLYLAMDYGVHMWKAFAGEDDKATLKNILAKTGEFAAFNELGAPFVSQVGEAIARDESLTLRDLANSTIPGSLINLGFKFWDHTGTFDDRTNRWDIIGKVWEAFVSFTPLLSTVRRVTGDPEMALAVRRRFELVPPKGGGGEQRFNEFHGKMRQAMQRLRELGDDPESDEWERVENILIEAIDAERDPGEELTDDERKQRVAESLSSRRMLSGINDDEFELLKNRIAPDLLRKLQIHDEMIEELKKMVLRQ